MKKLLENISCNWSSDSVRLINTPDPLIRRNMFYIQEAGYFKTSPPYFTERENLDSFLIVYTIAGHGKLICRNRQYDLKGGSLFFIDCMEHHYYECAEEETWEILWIHFQGISSRGYYEMFEKRKSPVMEVTDPESITKRMWAVIHAISEKTRQSELMCAMYITEILTEITASPEAGTQEAVYLPEYVKDVIKELDMSFPEGVSLEALARKVGISRYYLVRQFKKYTGNTIGGYVQIMRLNHAKELLKYTDLTVSEIAEACGMNHASYFVSIFRREEGITPLQYRHAWQG